jgi:hypothetical protein
VVFHALPDKKQPLSDVRRAEARSAHIESREGVARCFHVRLYSVEPSERVFACNLLAKDDARTVLANEPIKGRPEVSRVSSPLSPACRAERLAWRAPSKDGPVVWPSGLPQAIGPSSNSAEPVVLRKSRKVIGADIFNTSFVDKAGRDQASLY